MCNRKIARSGRWTCQRNGCATNKWFVVRDDWILAKVRDAMFRNWQCVALVVMALAAKVPAQDVPAGRQPLSPPDLYLLEGPQSVVVAPDGRRAAMIRRWVDSASRV